MRTHLACLTLSATALLGGCDLGPTPVSTTTSTFRDSTLIIETYAEQAPVVRIGDADREPTDVAALNEAASRGDPIAHRLLGHAYWKGSSSTMNGVDPFPQNPAHAHWYYAKGAQLGDPISAYWAGLGIEYGDGVEKDLGAALRYFEQAARSGLPIAHGRIGIFYALGEGVEIDYARAVKHLNIAANAGNALAQFNLGVMYEHGHSVEQSGKIAADWYFQSANQGNNLARVALAKLLRDGNGIPKDPGAAKQWLQLAADDGSEEAQTLLDDSASTS